MQDSLSLLIEEGKTPEGLYFRTYRLAGGGAPSESRPTVLVHGLDSNSDTMVLPADDFVETGRRNFAEGLAPELARKGRYVVAVDLPGHSRSAGYACDYSMEAMAESIRNVADYLELEGRLDFFSSCYGANVVLKFAKEHPEAFGVAVLSDPVIGFKAIPKKRVVSALLKLEAVLKYIPDKLFNFMEFSRKVQAKTEEKTGSTEEEVAWTRIGPEKHLPNKTAFRIMHGLRAFEKELYGGSLPYLEGSDIAVKYVGNSSYPRRDDLEAILGRASIGEYGFTSNHHAQMHPDCPGEVHETLELLSEAKYCIPGK